MSYWLEGRGGGQEEYPVSWAGLYGLMEKAGCREDVKQLKSVVELKGILVWYTMGILMVYWYCTKRYSTKGYAGYTGVLKVILVY